jgi:hypothetical protein
VARKGRFWGEMDVGIWLQQSELQREQLVAACARTQVQFVLVRGHMLALPFKLRCLSLCAKVMKVELDVACRVFA